MNRRLFTIFAAAAIAFVPLAASAAITPGTELTGTIDQGISSSNATVGQQFTVSNVHSADNNITGATIYGHVADVIKAGQGRPGQIGLAYDRLVTRSGNTYALNGRTTQVQVDTKNNALKEAGGALAGMIVGNIVGKAVGTNVGGLLGAAGGYVVAKNNRAQVSIPQGSTVTVQVLTARPQARR
jgi:hypothetical protein